jgi:hypothetical protein
MINNLTKHILLASILIACGSRTIVDNKVTRNLHIDQKDQRILCIDSFLTCMSLPRKNTHEVLDYFFGAASESELPYWDQLKFGRSIPAENIVCNDCLSYFLTIKQLELARKCGGFENLHPYSVEILKEESAYLIYRVTFSNDSVVDFYMDDIQDHIIMYIR